MDFFNKENKRNWFPLNWPNVQRYGDAIQKQK